jgi:stage V sporulation protein D (sporulation-specific penicillin-binding protein)
MKMGETIGKTTFLKFLNIFNIGLKTNIDLAGEARTASLVFTDSTMGTAELATSSFGQGYNVTMIEMITAFSSIVNGGYYYEPHVVSKIVNSNGDTVSNIEPRVLKQTISESTSEQMREYLYNVVSVGTGKTARPAGYEIGGKTGTAQTLPRGNGQYVVSFIGFAPADDPQIAIYCVIDKPNVEDQPHAYYATGVVKNILTEVLPYLHISKTVEMTIAEQEQVNAVLGNIVQSDAEEEDGDDDSDDNSNNDTGEVNDSQEDVGAFYVVDPDTGELKDPTTGQAAEVDNSLGEEEVIDIGDNEVTVTQE